MMKKRLLIIGCFLALYLPLWAVTQSGVVKTIARPDKPSERIEGAIIRVRGSHNAVESRENGSFSLLLTSLQAGDPYSIASIHKSGYEPAEQELIGRKIPCSEQVPLEVLMVNSAALRQEKEAIEARARENVELYYEARYKELEAQLAASRLSEQEFARRVQQLEGQYERFEPLLQTMSDKLARTDYNRLDSLTLRIQQAIEQGNPEEAERLVWEKGDLEAREKAIREREQQIQATQDILSQAALRLDTLRAVTAEEKRELADDYFRLYAAFLARFENDSAAFYICKRAELDTLNVDYQLQAGQFVKEMMNDFPLAKKYFDRAYRLTVRLYGEQSALMATTCQELGFYHKQSGRLDSAMIYYQRSLTIREEVRGKNSPSVAETLNNIGELYRAQKDFKHAMDYHQRALKIREKVFGTQSVEVAESKNNIAGLWAQSGQWNKAYALYQEVKAIYASEVKIAPRRVADNYTNLAVVAYKLGYNSEASKYMEQAANLYTQVLGSNHPQTRSAQQMLQTIQGKLND